MHPPQVVSWPSFINSERCTLPKLTYVRMFVSTFIYIPTYVHAQSCLYSIHAPYSLLFFIIPFPRVQYIAFERQSTGQRGRRWAGTLQTGTISREWTNFQLFCGFSASFGSSSSPSHSHCVRQYLSLFCLIMKRFSSDCCCNYQISERFCTFKSSW